MLRKLILIISSIFIFNNLVAQLNNVENPIINLNYNDPEKYEIGEITVSGIQFLDPNAIIANSGIKVGDIVKIPGETFTNAINKLWEQGILANVEIYVTKSDGRRISINFHLTERPRLSKFTFVGVRKGEADELKEKIRLVKGKVLTDPMLKSIQNSTKKYLAEKGFYNASINLVQEKDTSYPNSVMLTINIKKNKRVKVKEIIFEGNQLVESKILKRKLKDTKEKKWFAFYRSSKFKRKEYEDDKKKLINYYNTQGYRDAIVLSDSIYSINPKRIGVKLKIEEGRQYFFRNITWVGNYIYKTKTLDSILAIKKGDIYNIENLESKLSFNPNGLDISSLYLDNGYLFFSVDPVETKVDGDSVDIEMRIHEGAQATIEKIVVSGNTKTNDHVVLREIRTLPGQKFSRADIIRSQRELSQLGYFDPEKISINPIPNPAKGTVDIEYNVTEKPSDQLQLSGGWGGNFGFVGTLGLSFNNFSLKNIPHLKKWDPLPSGDGQRFMVNFQSNGPSYQNYSTSFSEPWLGGRKPHSFTVAFNHSVSRTGVGNGFRGTSSSFLNPTAQFNNQFYNPYATSTKGTMQLTSISVSLGKRIKWPDDYFTLLHSVSYLFYNLDNYQAFAGFSTGVANNLSLTNTLARNSIDNPTYPRRGANLSLSLQVTPPYSLFQPNRNFATETDAEKFKLVEYNKWMMDMSWFTQIAGNLVFNTRAHMGYLGSYNKNMPIGPFERFVVGGSGLSGFNFMMGYDLIGLRGYADRSIAPENSSSTAGVAYNKFVCELRYPISLNPAATVFMLAFAEGANNWGTYKEVNPFNLYRSAGVGARIFMPAFGLIGVDYGYGFDEVPGNPSGNKNRFTFSIGQQLR